MVMQPVIDRSRYFLLSPVLLIFFVCMMGEPLLSSSDEPALKRDDSTLRIEPLRLSALPGSALPNLTVDSSGDALLTWVEPDPDGRGDRLQIATLGKSGWSEPVTAARGVGWFVNWADFPSAAVLDDGTIAVHWLDRISAETYSYGVKVIISRDHGKTWGDPIIPHRDSSSTEHGFVALRPLGDRFYLAWLDGRAMAGGSGKAMTLRATTIDANGKRGTDRLLDDRVCDCCPVDVVVDGKQILVTYRDRDFLEVRDISWLKDVDGKVTARGLVHEDGWVQEGCPVNGPAVSSAAGKNAVAWYTGAQRVLGKPSPQGAVLGVQLLDDSQTGSSPPQRLDDGRPIGRVDLAGLADGSFVVCWIEREGDDAQVRVRRWTPGKPLASSHRIARVDPGRISGFPRIVAVTNGAVIVAWTATKVEGGTRAMTVRLPLAAVSSTPEPDND
jgi:hypothetical protein